MECDRLLLDTVIQRAGSSGSGFDCFREGSGYRLQLWGRLPAAWAGNLALHCFASGLDIESGDAERGPMDRWAASFRLRSTDIGAAPRVDFLMLARRAPRLVPPLPAPAVSVEISPSRDEPGVVLAHVTGPDSVGLLAELLRRFGAFGLRPREFTLRSRPDGVDDRFCLEPNRDTGRLE